MQDGLCATYPLQAPSIHYLRIGEDYPRYGLVVRFARRAKDVRRDDPGLILSDMGQLPDGIDIADRPEALARAQVRRKTTKNLSTVWCNEMRSNALLDIEPNFGI
jgi:hypothetical protein